MHIHRLLVSQPHMITDESGTWHSAIFRAPVDGPIELEQRGLVGDQVSNTTYHGSPDQAVCCHPLAHYDYWNRFYNLSTPEEKIGPGAVGENWTISNASEDELCVGDVFSVGSARVQVTGPRYPCNKQERKLKLDGFYRQTVATMRTGFYLRVLTPGIVQTGDALTLEQRPQPEVTVQRINVCVHQDFDPQEARLLMEIPEIGSYWRRILNILLEHKEYRPAKQRA